MDRSLWLLRWFTFRSWLRRSLRNLRTVRGIVSAAIWAIVFGTCMLGWGISAFSGAWSANVVLDASPSPDQIEPFGSLALLGLCLLTIMRTKGKGSIVAFLPAEIDFLVAGPFTRRQLLAYKLMSVLLALGFLPLIPLGLGASLQVQKGPFLARYAGILLALVFLWMVGMVLTALAQVVGVYAYGRVHKTILRFSLALVVAAVLYAGMTIPTIEGGALFRRLGQLPATQFALEVPRWFVRATLAEHYWPDFVVWGGASLAVDTLLLILLFLLDAQYVEGAAVAGEKVYAQIQRIRTQGAAGIVSEGSRAARFSMPALPWWRGIGPVAWRQLQSMVRRRSLLYFPLVLPLMMVFVANWALQRSSSPPNVLEVALPIIRIVAIAFLSLIVPGMLTFDFRLDLDRMDVLKTLPIGSVSLVIGQVLAPALGTTLLQALNTAALAVLAGRLDAALLLCAAFPLFIPLNFLIVGLENLVFLLCPSRPANAVSLGTQFQGQRHLLKMAQAMVLFLAIGTAAGLGLIVYLLADRFWPLAIMIGWVVLAAFAVAVVPLLALAFERFDVAREAAR